MNLETNAPQQRRFGFKLGGVKKHVRIFFHISLGTTQFHSCPLRNRIGLQFLVDTLEDFFCIANPATREPQSCQVTAPGPDSPCFSAQYHTVALNVSHRRCGSKADTLQFFFSVGLRRWHIHKQLIFCLKMTLQHPPTKNFHGILEDTVFAFFVASDGAAEVMLNILTLSFKTVVMALLHSQR